MATGQSTGAPLPALHVSWLRCCRTQARCCPMLGPGVPPTHLQLWFGPGSVQQQGCRGHMAAGRKAGGSSGARPGFPVAFSDPGTGLPLLIWAADVYLFPPMPGRGLWTPHQPCPGAHHLSTAPSRPPRVLWLWPQLCSPNSETCLTLPPTRISRAPTLCLPRSACLQSHQAGSHPDLTRKKLGSADLAGPEGRQ